ncbi:MAG TPA: family 43 glycosylhydrolase [Nocardioides sp.]|nr:family 43 glycosylhydrolase [Nocardioides sp.]
MDRPSTYRNALDPVVPGGGPVEEVDSCADPAVLRGRGADHRYWYLYCTTDPLSDTDLDTSGELVFHPVPMLRSRDLVNWKYVGDALPEPPSWAAEGAGLWAPDVVYSKATRRYYLTFTVTDTDDELRGADACASDGDSAIGVAVSSSPTGPWTVAHEPLVAPRPDPEADCEFFWTFDPDVLGDAVGARSTLYYGSYYGGVHAAQVTFDAAGAELVGTATRIAIGNRYEGSNVVKRRGWYWYFGSATNCCNGPLTSYGVFAARSRSPLGPFRDRTGQSLLAGRVGGSPVLLPNGNRWLGVGHNSVFTDAAGRWWTAYHAVDRRDPYFATEPGFTKRPVLLDPVTWRGGWPEVRGGRWASDRRMPGPATHPRRPSAYRPERVEPLHPGALRPEFSDDFSDGLEPAWRWLREPPAGDAAVEAGVLRFATQPGDLARDDDDTAPVLSRRAPRGDYVVQTRVRLDVPAEGCCQNFVQAGLVLIDNDDRYLKLVHASLWETRQTEWAKEVQRAPEGYPRYGNGVVGPPGPTTWLRVVVDRRRGADHYTAFTSDDGRKWVRGGTWTHTLSQQARIGLVSMGGDGFTARFLEVEVRRLRR